MLFYLLGRNSKSKEFKLFSKLLQIKQMVIVRTLLFKKHSGSMSREFINFE